MRLGAVVAFRQQLLLQEGDDIAVLGVDERHGAELGAARERREHLVVVHHQRALVGHEMLEGVDALLDHLRHLVKNLLVPPGDRHVERVVGARLAGLLVPLLQRVEQALLRRRQAEVDDHRRAAGECRGSSRVEVVGGERAHEGHFHVRVRVDAARHDVAARRVDDVVGGVLKVGADRDDLVVLHEDVGLGGEIGGDDGAAFDELGHVSVPRLVGRWRSFRQPALGNRQSEGGRASPIADCPMPTAFTPRSPPSPPRRGRAPRRRRSPIPA